MNERIKELAEQAGFNLIQHGDHIIYDISTKENMSEFARLIVQECIRVPYDMWDKAELNADIAVKIEHRIRAHFGVEE